MSDARSKSLRWLFARVLSGKQLLNPNSAKLFIEAICDQPDPSVSVQRIVACPAGMPALQSALRMDTSTTFLSCQLTPFLLYLQEPLLKSICGGDVLQQVVMAIVESPMLWSSLIRFIKSKHAPEHVLDGFSWLLLELLTLPTERAIRYIGLIKEVHGVLLESSQTSVRMRTHRLLHIADTITTPQHVELNGPGGRHDNDFAEIRKIAVLPTPDELASSEPFLRRAVELEENDTGGSSLALHIENQFRLSREDLLRDVRSEIQSVLAPSANQRRRAFCIENLSVAGVLADERQKWSLQFRCMVDLPQMRGKSYVLRKRFLEDNPRFLGHQSVACLMIHQEIVALVTIVRDEELLLKYPPVLCVQFSEAVVEKHLLRLSVAKNIRLVQLSTAFFAYEPVLKQLKEIKELSLEDDIYHWYKDKPLSKPSYKLSPDLRLTLAVLSINPAEDLKDALGLQSSTKLDEAQAACFRAALEQRLSLIQGPPGTGKSFIGSLIAKAIHMHSDETILIICYTHHALDQFTEDLLDMKIPPGDIVRLGSSKKATVRTEPLSLWKMRPNIKLKPDQWSMLNLRKLSIANESKHLKHGFNNFRNQGVRNVDLMEHLEFLSDDLLFHDAFQVPEDEQGEVTVGRHGKAVDGFYLLDRWSRGKDAGMFKRSKENTHAAVWGMSLEARIKELDKWRETILKERINRIHELGTKYNSSIDKIKSIYLEKDLRVIREKRIICCTTTAAAKYVQTIQSIAPGVVLVEEAGEILESHILTALGPETKQLILIGDHKQLRPKAHHDLSVEKGDGYDLNRSLFERLVLKGYSHNTLRQQHRMRPELSNLVRQLTYPDLTDARSTQGRPDLRGFRDNLVFVSHFEPEVEMQDTPDWKDGNSKSSKENMFEAKMTLKCVRYLGQQGYRTNEIAILTPYLGQLRLLLDELGKETDPVLNDLDSYDLVRAGLLPPATARLKKPRIRLSTIDNYQGEESDIVIVSLTRSNSRGDIGFMTSPERLNVLLSRARNALILFGNAETFMQSKKGKDLWERFLTMLKVGHHLYDGLPVKCERHPQRTMTLSRPEDFDEHCPDGGCSEPCGALLNCGLHACPQHCHQLYDHSKMSCDYIMESKCSKGHVQRWKCHLKHPQNCRTCDQEDAKHRRRVQAEFERQETSKKAQTEHFATMAKLDEEIRLLRENAADDRATEERAEALEQKKRDLDAAKRMADQKKTESSPDEQNAERAQDSPSPKSQKDSNPPHADKRGIKSSGKASEKQDSKSPAEIEWERQKRVDGCENDAIDKLMGLTGLEDAKLKILSVMSKIETMKRQGIDLKSERLGIVLLGNPGTGKTTVARLYGQFLVSMGLLPGTEFVETSGSRLGNEGVAGAKKQLESICNSGGGVFFIDETYQLVNDHTAGSKAVLDFLLAEIEGLVGRVVFILAGYSREMEKFFEHNPGFDSRVPLRLHFADYTNAELLSMLDRLIGKKYQGRMNVEDGVDGLYARISVNRLGRSRGREGYGNARALENVFAKITERQANRLQRERAVGEQPDDFLLTKEDLIGPEPSSAIQESKAWTDLHDLIGLASVKASVNALVSSMQFNYERELEEKPIIEVSLNRVFLGPPGTGKTSVGKLYGAILADIGLLSKGEVIVKNPADFIGSVLGESERKTKAILKASEGKVLIVDEAYMLHAGSQSRGNTSDPYRAAVIDTIVAEVQSTPGDDRCVLLLGYKDEMQDMLDNSNPGLARRFPLSQAFIFEDFDDQQLRQILNLKLSLQGLDATEDARDVAIAVLSRARDRPHFGNAGEVENMISRAKFNQQRRRMTEDGASRRNAEVMFLPQDFDEAFDRTENAAVNCRKLFADVIGCGDLIDKLEKYQKVAANMRARDMDPRDHIPFNFIFKGPPGTGKTTTARKMGQVFYNMGLLATPEYKECSASDLIAPFVGQTGPKTLAVLKASLGMVLFVDEAYRLSEGDFAKEAIDELVDRVTKPQFHGKIVVILAGYDEDMNRLLRVNPGLASRFAEEFVFTNMNPDECLTLLQLQLKQTGIELASERRDTRLHHAVIDRFEKLAQLPSWGNGRDITTLSKAIAMSKLENADSAVSPLSASNNDVLTALEMMLNEQLARCRLSNKPRQSGLLNKIAMTSTSNILPQASSSLNAAVDVEAAKAPVLEETAAQSPQLDEQPLEVQRDADVSEAVWSQLQDDITAEEATQTRIQDEIAELKRGVGEARAIEQAAASDVSTLEAKAADDNDNESKRLHEEARLRELLKYRALQEAEDKLQIALQEEDKRRKEEVKVQKKLRKMGVCPVGYRWIRQETGYRCAGGSHFVSHKQLERPDAHD